MQIFIYIESFVENVKMSICALIFYENWSDIIIYNNVLQKLIQDF